MSVQLQISKDVAPAFLACLGLGTLHAIRAGVIPAEVGIWTMGPPKVWMPIQEWSLVSQEIIRVFKVSDELSALQELAPEKFDERVTKLIERLEIMLAQAENPNWGMGLHWVGESDQEIPNRGWAKGLQLGSSDEEQDG